MTLLEGVADEIPANLLHNISWIHSQLETHVARRNTVVELTYDTCHQTKKDSDGDEGPVPGVRSVHCGHTQKYENECLADAAPHFQEVLDGGVGLVGYVGLHVGPHYRSTRY